ncbi:MAG: SDR family NAD(P)-dependent oxidoreductase [Mycobacterium sp.]
MPSVLVTGAGRGIGLAITEHTSRQGWDVDATARSADALQSLARLPNVHAISLDITDRSNIAVPCAPGRPQETTFNKKAASHGRS